MVRLDIAANTVTAFCERNGIRRLALFGSVLRDDFRSEGHADVLGEVELGFAP